MTPVSGLFQPQSNPPMDRTTIIDPIPPKAIKISPLDSVAVALVDLMAGDELLIADQSFVCLEDIERGHKLSVQKHKVNDLIFKYGHPIGRATMDIAVGAWVHEHNLSSLLNYSSQTVDRLADNKSLAAPMAKSQMIKAYRRHDGAIAIRNQIFIIALVGCVAKTAERLAQWAKDQFSGEVDDVIALTHPHGCSQTGDDRESTKAILAALACHPHAGGVLVIGLGCETNKMDAFLTEVNKKRAPLPERFQKLFSAVHR